MQPWFYTMKCSNCGDTRLQPGFRFCPGCGSNQEHSPKNDPRKEQNIVPAVTSEHPKGDGTGGKHDTGTGNEQVKGKFSVRWWFCGCKSCSKVLIDVWFHFFWRTAQNPSFIVNFPKWWKTEKFNIILTFSDIWTRMANLLFTLSKTQEKREVYRMLPCTSKMPMNHLFSSKFFYSFPVHPNAAFSMCFPTDLLTVKAMKTRYLWIVFLLHENARV